MCVCGTGIELNLIHARLMPFHSSIPSAFSLYITVLNKGSFSLFSFIEFISYFIADLLLIHSVVNVHETIVIFVKCLTIPYETWLDYASPCHQDQYFQGYHFGQELST